MVSHRVGEGFPVMILDSFQALARRTVMLSPLFQLAGRTALLSALFLVSACDQDKNCTEPTRSRSCPSGSRPTSATLHLTYSNPSGYDSVIIEVYRGNADNGARIRRFRAQGGTGSETFLFGESEWGDISGKAIYYRGQEIDDVFDGGDLGVNSSTDECQCTTYSEDNLELDLRL